MLLNTLQLLIIGCIGFGQLDTVSTYRNGDLGMLCHKPCAHSMLNENYLYASFVIKCL